MTLSVNNCDLNSSPGKLEEPKPVVLKLLNGIAVIGWKLLFQYQEAGRDSTSLQRWRRPCVRRPLECQARFVARKVEAAGRKFYLETGSHILKRDIRWHTQS
jgi:hypothetical protein